MSQISAQKKLMYELADKKERHDVYIEQNVI